MTHPIFNIPEILRLICKKASRYNLAPLLTVSRRFFISAIPFVWERSRSEYLRKLVFPEVDIKEVDDAWLDGVQPLDEESVDRFYLYAQYVKRIDDYIDWKREDVTWVMLLKAIPGRPLLPNLQALIINDHKQSTRVSQIIDALLCPTLVEIRAPGRRSGSSHPVLSPQRIARIAELCPSIQTLQFYSKPVRGHLHIESPSGTPPSDNLFTSLGKLRGLRFLGAGPEVLSFDALVLLGNLPCLESLMLCIPRNTPERSIPNQFPQTTGSFPALQHLSIYCNSPPLLSRLWKLLPVVRRITSVWIKVDTELQTTDDDVVMRDLLSSVCQFSPCVTDLHVDLATQQAAFELDLFTPSVLSDLARLPLRRMRIQTVGTQLVPPEDYEQLAMALPNLEYLDIQECNFTFQGLEYVAKYMPGLQYLSVALRSSDWPSKDELPLAPSSSPAVLCLRALFTFDTGSSEQNNAVDDNYVESISTALHRLWPNGVRCEFSQIAAEWCEQSDCETLELINSSIKQFCPPNEFKTPDTRLAANLDYIDSEIELELLPYIH